MALFANEPSDCHHFVRLQPLIETRKALPLVDWYVLLNIRHKLFFTWHFQPNIQSSVVWIRFSAWTASIHTIPNRRRKVFKQYQSLPEGLSSSGCGTVPLCGPGELCGAPTCSRKTCHWTPPCLQDKMLKKILLLECLLSHVLADNFGKDRHICSAGLGMKPKLTETM